MADPDQPYFVLLEALASGRAEQLQQALTPEALRPLADPDGKHARVLLDRLLDTDDPALAQALISAGALSSTRVREAALQRGAQRLAQGIAAQLTLPGQGPVSRALGALPAELLAVPFAVLTAGLILVQVLLAYQLVPTWIDWAFTASPTAASCACIVASLLQAGAISLGLLGALERRGW